MPTVIALDLSLSMLRGVGSKTNGETITYHQMAIHLINEFLDYLSLNAKLEYVSLVSSYLCNVGY